MRASAAQRLPSPVPRSTRRGPTVRAARAWQPGQPGPGPATVAPSNATSSSPVERLNPQTFDLNYARLQASYRPTLTSFVRRNSQSNLPAARSTAERDHPGHEQLQRRHRAEICRWAAARDWCSSTTTASARNPSSNYTRVQHQLQRAAAPAAARLHDRQHPPQLRITPSTATSRKRSCAAPRDNGGLRAHAYWELSTPSTRWSWRRVDVARRAPGHRQRGARRGRHDGAARRRQASPKWRLRRQAVAQAEATGGPPTGTKRLIVNGTEDPLWRAATPDGPADVAPEALERRRRGAQGARRRLDLDGAAAPSTPRGNAPLPQQPALPAVDVTAAYGAVGLGGTQLVRAGSSV